MAVEMDEAGAETLGKDINFYRRMLSGRDVVFLPDPNGAETSGARAKVFHSLQETDSLVTSSKNLVTSLRDKGASGENTVWLRAGGAGSLTFIRLLRTTRSGSNFLVMRWRG